MRLTKRQLKRIIREEYSRLKRRGLISESGYRRFPTKEAERAYRRQKTQDMLAKHRSIEEAGGAPAVVQLCKSYRSGATMGQYDSQTQLEMAAEGLADAVESGRFTMEDLFEAEEMCQNDDFCYAVIEMCLSDYL